MEILKKTDERLEFILDFNKRLAIFDKNVSDLEDWLGEGRKRLDGIKNPTELLSPEDRVTKTMEVQEDINKKSEFCGKQETEKGEIFPKGGEKVSSDAKKFIEDDHPRRRGQAGGRLQGALGVRPRDHQGM